MSTSTRELVGVAEAAKLLGWTPQNVRGRRDRDVSFPRPVARLACGDIWDANDILSYKQTNPPTPKRRWRRERYT